MKLFKSVSGLLLITATLFSFVHADEVAIPVGAQGAEKASLDRPKVGMKADAVEAKFGAPLKKSAAVGKPPISTWEYPYYNVYFESDRVIHTVLKPYSDETPPAPAVTEPGPAAPEMPAAEPAPTAPVAEAVPAEI